MAKGLKLYSGIKDVINVPFFIVLLSTVYQSDSINGRPGFCIDRTGTNWNSENALCTGPSVYEGSRIKIPNPFRNFESASNKPYISLLHFSSFFPKHYCYSTWTLKRADVTNTNAVLNAVTFTRINKSARFCDYVFTLTVLPCIFTCIL